MGGAGEHCGERHSLSDDHQPDDQHEKPFAETTHENRSNPFGIVGVSGRLPRQIKGRNETSRTSNRYSDSAQGAAEGRMERGSVVRVTGGRPSGGPQGGFGADGTRVRRESLLWGTAVGHRPPTEW